MEILRKGIPGVACMAESLELLESEDLVSLSSVSLSSLEDVMMGSLCFHWGVSGLVEIEPKALEIGSFGLNSFLSIV